MLSKEKFCILKIVLWQNKKKTKKCQFFLQKIKVKYLRPPPHKIEILRTAQNHHGSVKSFDNENIEQSLTYLTFGGFMSFSRINSEY